MSLYLYSTPNIIIHYASRFFHLTFADFSLSLEMTTFEDDKGGQSN